MKVDIIYTVWIRDIERLACFINSIKSLKKYLIINGLEVEYHIAVEHQMGGDLFNSFIGFCQREDLNIHWKTTEPSLSSAINFSLSCGNAPYILFMQDDWLLTEELYLLNYTKHLSENEDDYIIRLIWRDEFHDKSTHLKDDLHILKPDMIGYYYSDNPHLKKRTYHNFTGLFTNSIVNGIDQGRCENSMNAKAKSIGDKYRILVVDRKLFIHIGYNCTTLTEKTFGGG